MAIVHCWSGGSNTAPHETWAKAATTLATAVTALGATDDLWLADDHTETTGTTTYTFSATVGVYHKVFSVERTGSTYSKASASQWTSSGLTNCTFTGYVKLYGVFFTVGNQFIAQTSPTRVEFHDSKIQLTRSSGEIQTGSTSSGATFKLFDTEVFFSNSGTSAKFDCNGITDYHWKGGLLSITGTQPTVLFNDGSRYNEVLIEDVDLSAFTGTLFTVSDANVSSKCRLYGGIISSSVTLATAVGHPDSWVKASGVDDTTGNNIYRQHFEGYYGVVSDDDATYLTAGASDGSDNISFKMVSNANTQEISTALETPMISGWVDSTGSKTFTVEILTDNVTLQDDEIWLEVYYLNASANTGRAAIRDRITDLVGSPANQATSTEAWTEALGTPVKQKLTVTATVNRVGPFKARVFLAKASTTVYIDPLVVIS